MLKIYEDLCGVKKEGNLLSAQVSGRRACPPTCCFPIQQYKMQQQPLTWMTSERGLDEVPGAPLARWELHSWKATEEKLPRSVGKLV